MDKTNLAYSKVMVLMWALYLDGWSAFIHAFNKPTIMCYSGLTHSAIGWL